MIYVINRNQISRKNENIDISRYGTLGLGNPYVMKKEADRNKVIDQYQEWLFKKIEEQDRRICGSLNYIYSKSLEGDVYLVCFCAPKPCHGDVIKYVVENMSNPYIIKF